MAYITTKNFKGKTYYYAEQRIWKNGRSLRAWQKYLGTIDKIINSIEGKHLTPSHAILFELGAIAAYLNISEQIELTKIIDKLLPKRKQNISIGAYILIAAINRGIKPVSKHSMWNWFQDTVLLHHFAGIKKEQLTSQRFWDHMDKIPEDRITDIWKSILNNVLNQLQPDLSMVSYDETNFFTFISSFNNRCTIAQRGKNKQGRANLRQVNYALFYSNKTHIPLYFDVYQGNHHDSKKFKSIIPKFRETFKNQLTKKSKITLIFDKGNNSPENIALLNKSEFQFVGSLKLKEHSEFAELSNKDKCFKQMTHPKLEQIKAYRTKKEVYSKEVTIVVTYYEKLHKDQTKTINKDIEKCQLRLSALYQKLIDRANGLITKGKKPTKSSIEKNIKEILKRQFMKRLFTITYENKNGLPLFNYEFDAKEYAKVLDTYIGKKIIFTNNHHWKTEDIIMAYHSQFIIEHVFKDSKDRNTGCWWPLNHWTDQKIKVHGLYCTIALLIRSLINIKLEQAGIKLSSNRLHEKLQDIKEVNNVYLKPKGKGNKKALQTKTITKMDEIQQKLFELFEMNKYIKS